MIEGIEELRAELEFGRFGTAESLDVREGEIFEERKIEVVNPGPPNIVAAGVAESAWRLKLKRCDIEILRHVPLARTEIRIRNHVRTFANACSTR